MSKDKESSHKRPAVGNPRLTKELRIQYGAYNTRLQMDGQAPLSFEAWLKPDYGTDKNGNVFEIK